MERTLGLFFEELHKSMGQQLSVQSFEPDPQPSLSVSIKKTLEKERFLRGYFFLPDELKFKAEVDQRPQLIRLETQKNFLDLSLTDISQRI